ncbi:cation efflux family protein [Ostertagia ostertagi]
MFWGSPVWNFRFQLGRDANGVKFLSHNFFYPGMSTVPEQDESTQKIILPEPYSHSSSSTPAISRQRSLDPSTAKRTAESSLTEPSATTTSNGTCFGLLDNEEEERLLGDSAKPLPFIGDPSRAKAGRSPIVARHASTAPSLRSISLPKGSSPQSSSELPHSASVATVHPPHSGSSPARIPLTQSELRKPKKVVSQYYKRQNELLENFKNDSEQIQVFQKVRTRQRLISSTSTEGDITQKDDSDVLNRSLSRKDSKISNNNLSSSWDTTAPLLKNTDGEQDLEIGNAPSNRPLVDPADDRKASIASDISILAKHEAAMDAARATSKAASRLAHATLIVNITLMLAKGLASYLSGSLSILSSLVDSCVDITSGLVISISTRMIKKRDPYLYPRGRTRLEPLSLIIISVVMGVASVQLIFGAISRIAAAYQFHVHGVGEKPTLDVSFVSASIMVSTVIVKFSLFCICQKYKSDPSIAVLAMDHRNDCLSNTVALACAWLGTVYWYYLDPIGAILVSLYILYTWVSTGWDHLSKLSGKSAKPEFINRIIKVV